MAITVKKGDASNIHQQVVTVVSTPARVTSSDVQGWKDAVNAAKTGRPTALYKLYENLLADGMFWRTIEKRLENITNSDIVFSTAKGKTVPEVDILIDTPEFEKLLREIMLAKAWGISVIDVMQVLPHLDIFSVPRRNIYASKKMIIANEYDETGLDYSTIPYIFEVKGDDELGFIYKAAIYVIFKRGGFGDWAQFVELFGMPFRLGKYSSYDTNTRDEIVRSLEMFGGAPWAVVPKEAEFEYIQNTSSGNGETYDKFIDRCDREMLITILGQTMTTVDGSSKSQSETHKDVEESINKSDRRFVQRILNRHLVPILEMSGINVAGGAFGFPEQGEALSTKDRLDIAITVKNNGIPVADDYIYEVSGVAKPQAGQVVSRNMPAFGAAPEDGKDGKPDSKLAEPTALGRMLNFFAEALGKRAPLKF